MAFDFLFESDQLLSCTGRNFDIVRIQDAARLRRASNFTLFDWAGPKRTLGEQNHAPLCLVQVSFKQLVEGESCAGYWKKLSMNEITQVGTETFNN